MNDERNDGKRYNGWANYETWAVKLWLDNEEGSYRYWSEEARSWSGRDDAAIGMAKQLKEDIEEGAPTPPCGLYSDLLNAALSEVDWYEIAESYLEEVDEEWTDDPDMCDAPPMPSPAPEERHQEEPTETETEPVVSDLEEIFGPVISRYTRREAIQDGMLIDVTETAKEAGFKIPVALTHTVWAESVEVPEGVECQDEAGRLWDVLFMCRVEIGRSQGRGSEILFRLHVRNDNRDGEPPLVTLKAVCGPNDDASPCITIMNPDED